MVQKSIMSDTPPISDKNDDYVFISYAHTNKDSVYEDLWKLSDYDVHYRYDDHFKSGQSWLKIAENDISDKNCKLIIFFLSKDSIISGSVKEEVKIAKKYNKNYIYIKMFDQDIDDVYRQGIIDRQLNMDDIALLREFFNEKNIYVTRNSPDYINEVISHIIKYGLNVSAKVIKKHREFKKILILAKNSSFSKSIINGINDTLLKVENVVVKTILIDKHLDITAASIQFNEILQGSIQEYDCFILRPPEKYLQSTLEIIKHILSSGKKVILSDINLKKEQICQLKNKPSFVGSNFNSGGNILSKKVLEIIKRLNSTDVKIIFAKGPLSYNTATIRCMSFINDLKTYIKSDNIIEVILDTFNADANSDKFEQLAGNWAENGDFNNSDVFIYCGNDNIASALMQALNSFKNSNLKSAFSQCRNIIFIGYDGLKDINNDWMLSKFGYNYITIDVVPFKQGNAIGNMAIDLMFNNASSCVYLEQPELVENLYFPIIKTSKIDDAIPLIKDKKVFIFDLDGTIADTESLHWIAYDRLLQKYGVKLDKEHINSYIGHAETAIYKMIKNDFDINFDDAQFLSERIAIYKQLVLDTNLQTFKIITDLLPLLKDKVLLLVTSQLPSVVKFLLEKWKLSDYFLPERIFCCHDGIYNKATIYKNISEYANLHITDKDVVLLEDSEHYLSEGMKNHFTTLGIEHKYNKDKLKSCDIILSDNYVKGVFVGLCGLDIVYYNPGEMPKNNTKLKINNYDCFIGGPAANAAITYSLLGGKAYLITAIGDSFMGKTIKSLLKKYDIDVIDIAEKKPEFPNISGVYINTLNGDRTVFSGQNQMQIKSVRLSETVFAECDFALYDGNLPCVENELLSLIQSFEKPLVIDAGSHKKGFKRFFEITTDVIASQNYCDENGCDIFDLKEFYDFKFAAQSRGNLSVLYLDEDGVKRELEVPQVKANDTLGAGDVLHGAYCFYKFVKKYDAVSAMKRAIRISSCKVEKRGVVNGVRYAIDLLENEWNE